MEALKQIRWKVTGGGIFTLGRTEHLPGSVFLAFPYQIPETFRDVIRPVDYIPQAPEVQEITATGVKPTFIIEPSKRDGYFNVVNEATGKVMNGKILKEDAAKIFLQDLLK